MSPVDINEIPSLEELYKRDFAESPEGKALAAKVDQYMLELFFAEQK